MIGERVGGEGGRQPALVRRIPFVHPVRVRPLSEVLLSERLFATDLSRGGMFVRSTRPLAPGTRLEIGMEAKGLILPFAQAEVAWRRTVDEASSQQKLPGFGLRFVELKPSSRALVEHLMRVARRPSRPTTTGQA